MIDIAASITIAWALIPEDRGLSRNAAAAVVAIAKKTLERGTGARGLRSIIESIMREVMFEIPSRSDVREVVVTEESIEHAVSPLLVLHPEERKLEA